MASINMASLTSPLLCSKMNTNFNSINGLHSRNLVSCNGHVSEGFLGSKSCSIEKSGGRFKMSLLPVDFWKTGVSLSSGIETLEADSIITMNSFPHVADEYDLDRPTSGFSSVPDAIEDIRQGKMVMVVDDEDRENEGDLVMAAASATPEAMTFFVKHGTGIVCVSMKGEDLERLQLPLMVTHNEDKNRTTFTVSVDAKHGTTTGDNDKLEILKPRGSRWVMFMG